MSSCSGQEIVIPLSDCDKVRKRLAVSKQTTHRFHMERFSHKKLNEIEGNEKYCVEISNRFTALENLDATGEY
jgi:hypothetical protein